MAHAGDIIARLANLSFDMSIELLRVRPLGRAVAGPPATPPSTASGAAGSGTSWPFFRLSVTP